MALPASGHHGAHLLLAFGGRESPEDRALVRLVFGERHTVAVDAAGAAVAVVCLGLRGNHRALRNTRQVCDDRVRVAASAGCASSPPTA